MELVSVKLGFLEGSWEWCLFGLRRKLEYLGDGIVGIWKCLGCKGLVLVMVVEVGGVVCWVFLGIWWVWWFEVFGGVVLLFLVCVVGGVVWKVSMVFCFGWWVWGGWWWCERLLVWLGWFLE